MKRETWVFGVREGTRPEKYQEERLGVVILASPNPKVGQVLAMYAEQYNLFNIRDADNLVKSGRYDEAGTLYRCVLRFNRPGALNDTLVEKLSIVERLQAGRDIESSSKRFAKLW